MRAACDRRGSPHTATSPGFSTHNRDDDDDFIKYRIIVSKNKTIKDSLPLRERVHTTVQPLGGSTVIRPLLRGRPGEGFDKAGTKSVHGQFRQRGVNLSKLPQRLLRQKARRIREGGDHREGDLIGFGQLQAPY